MPRLTIPALLAMTLLSATLLGCSAGGSSAEPVLCEVAHNLTFAAATTQQAVAKQAAGDTEAARTLATDARARAQRAHDQLQTISSDEVRHGATWQALLGAYLNVGQAANALLPGFEGTSGMADEELASALPQLRTAAAALPASCTTVDESPGVAPA